MGKKSFLAMETTDSSSVASDLIGSDLKELGMAAKNLANHAIMLAGGLGFGTSFLSWVASFAAIYLLILDRTNWRTNMLTTLLIPYIFFSLPSLIFSFLRHFPDWLEAPAALILLIVVAPGMFADTLRGMWVGVAICLIIGCYLLQEHIRASGGFRNSFTKAHGISNTVGIVLLLVYPVWALVLYIL